jgi:hypothetical protein
MRLSDFKGEKVFDVMSELLDPVAEILSDSQLATEYKSKPKIVVAQYILKHHKDETIKILAILADKSVDDYLAGVNIISLTKDVLELLGDEQLMVFLQAQRKSEDESSSSLPAANIVE